MYCQPPGTATSAQKLDDFQSFLAPQWRIPRGNGPPDGGDLSGRKDPNITPSGDAILWPSASKFVAAFVSIGILCSQITSLKPFSILSSPSKGQPIHGAGVVFSALQRDTAEVVAPDISMEEMSAGELPPNDKRTWITFPVADRGTFTS